MADLVIKWKAQPRQLKFLRACGLGHAFDGGKPSKPLAKMVGFGGAAGGGKSDCLLMAGIISCLTFPGVKVGYFRRTYSQLEGPGGAIMRSNELLAGKAKWNGKLRRWSFPGGSFLQFCYLDRDEDCQNYQSQMFDAILFDESTQMTEYMIRYMTSRCRATTNTAMGTFIGLATNPGNISHVFFKEQFVDIGEPEIPHVVEIDEGKYETHIFIPSTLADNKVLEERDPEYRRNLENLPEILRRQFLEGDWEIAEGVAFTEWKKNIHVCEPFSIPKEWIRIRTLDWGYAKPFAVGWYAVDFDGRMYKYREYYGWNGKKDEGCKLDPEDVAKRIIELEKGEEIRFAVADDAVFGGRQDNSPSIAEQFAHAFGSKAKHWTPVGKGPRSRISGKLELHHRFKWNKNERGEWDGIRPMMVIFNNCLHTIRTIPSLILDSKNPEDVDTTQEDHIYDETRYSAMSRPMTPKLKKEEPSRIEKHKQKLYDQRRSHIRIV